MAEMHSSLVVLFLVATFIVAMVLVPLVILLARRLGAVEQGGYRKINNKPIPLMGGVAVALPFILACASLVYLNAADLALAKDLLVLLLGSIIIVLVGVIDDTVGMRARTKLLAQFLTAVMVCATNFVLTGITLPFVGYMVFGNFVGAVISIFWIVGLINAFNLIDGVDGLATGLALIASLALAVMEGLSGNVIVVYLFLALAGSLAAFLIFNFNPARIFLGDTGSMFLGYIIAMLTLMGTYKAETAVIVFAPLLILGLPIFETLVSMTRRYLRGVPIFSSDGHHTHHRLLRKGYSQRKVVLLLYSVTILLSAWAILGKILPNHLLWIPLLLFMATLGWMAWVAAYICIDEFGKLSSRRRRNVMFVALAKYASLSIGTFYREGRSHDVLLDMVRKELGLRHLQVLYEEREEPLFESGRGSVRAGTYPIEQFCLNTASGERIVVSYQYDHMPTEHDQHDVAACLANIFGDLRLPVEVANCQQCLS